MRFMQVAITFGVMVIALALGAIQLLTITNRLADSWVMFFSIETALIIALSYGWFFQATMTLSRKFALSTLVAATFVGAAAIAPVFLLS